MEHLQSPSCQKLELFPISEQPRVTPSISFDLEWADSYLSVMPFLPAMAMKLRYWHRSLKMIRYRMQPVGEYVDLYRMESTPDGTRLVTFSGFRDLVLNWIKENGHAVRSMKDSRWPLPPPRLEAIKHVRFSQADAVMALLLAERSSIVQCPTRYGKTYIMANVLRAFPGLYSVVCAPNYEICAQLFMDLKKMLPERKVDILTSEQNTVSKKLKEDPNWHPGKLPSDDVTVTTFQSLRHCFPEAVRLCLIDEVHAAAAPATVHALNSLCKARRYGFSATTEGRFDGADILTQGLVGPVVMRITFQEAVAQKALLPIHVHVVREIHPAPDSVQRGDGTVALHYPKTRNNQYRSLAHRNEQRAALWGKICNDIIPADWQTLIFVKTEEQGDLLAKFIKNSVFVMARNFKSKKERADFKAALVAGEVVRCIATDIYGTGMTFPKLRAQCNACGGGGSISAVQKPGRLAGLCGEIGKTAGHLFEIYDDQRYIPKEHMFLQKDSESRCRQYKKLAYSIHQYENIGELIGKFKDHA